MKLKKNYPTPSNYKWTFSMQKKSAEHHVNGDWVHLPDFQYVWYTSQYSNLSNSAEIKPRIYFHMSGPARP